MLGKHKNPPHVEQYEEYKAYSQHLREQGNPFWDDAEENHCNCGPKDTCPVCLNEKLKQGISPKFDQGKLQYSLIPPEAMKALASVLTFGAEKYARNSWQNLKHGENRYMDALFRHIEAHRDGEEFDKDSGMSHLWHAITNLSFLIHFQKEALNVNKKKK